MEHDVVMQAWQLPGSGKGKVDLHGICLPVDQTRNNITTQLIQLTTVCRGQMCWATAIFAQQATFQAK